MTKPSGKSGKKPSREADKLRERIAALEVFGQVDSTLSRKFEGTGLGLPLTRSLVELHGGVFFIESKPGEGTVVTVTLPKNRVLNRSTAAE